MTDDAQSLIPHVREKLGNYQGQVISVSDNDVTITLSGLLGLVWKSGIRGAEKWLENPADRTKYPNTTKAFISTNGLF